MLSEGQRYTTELGLMQGMKIINFALQGDLKSRSALIELKPGHQMFTRIRSYTIKTTMLNKIHRCLV